MKFFTSALMSGVIFFLFCITGNAHAQDETHPAGKTMFTKHFQESLFSVTEKGEFSVEILLNEKEYKIGRNVIGIVIHDKHDKDVEGADIKVFSRAQETAAASDKGGGLYTVKDLDITKEGARELRVQIKIKDIEDSAIFSFPFVMQRPLPAGKYAADDPAFRDR